MEDMPKPVMATKICNLNVQGDTSGCGETPVDTKTTVLFYPGLARPKRNFCFEVKGRFATT